jgi:hypothetical protein
MTAGLLGAAKKTSGLLVFSRFRPLLMHRKSMTINRRLNAASYWSLGCLISRNPRLIYLDATKGRMSGAAETI